MNTRERDDVGESIRILGRRYPMPGTRGGRIGLGAALVVGGVFGFLPVLGFWMIPLGGLVLSREIHAIRRIRRQMVIWRGRSAQRRANRPESEGKDA